MIAKLVNDSHKKQTYILVIKTNITEDLSFDMKNHYTLVADKCTPVVKSQHNRFHAQGRLETALPDIEV